MTERREQNVAQRTITKHKSNPIGCIENAEKKKDFSHCNVEISLFPLIMIMDDSTKFQEEQNQNSYKKRLLNELASTYSLRGQSILIAKCVGEQVLRIWLEIFSTYMDIYFLDFKIIMESESNEMKNVCTISFEGSKERQLTQLNECWTLLMKYGIFGRTMTLIEETDFWNIWLCYVNMW